MIQSLRNLKYFGTPLKTLRINYFFNNDEIKRLLINVTKFYIIYLYVKIIYFQYILHIM